MQGNLVIVVSVVFLPLPNLMIFSLLQLEHGTLKIQHWFKCSGSNISHI